MYSPAATASINNTPVTTACTTADTGPEPDAHSLQSESSTPPPPQRLKVAVIDQFTQGRILGYHEVGLSNREIGRRIGRNEATVRAVVKK